LPPGSEEIVEAVFMKRRPSVPENFELSLIALDTDDVMPDMSQAGRNDRANVPAAYHGDSFCHPSIIAYLGR
jgi:hypothetical protein